MAIHGNSIVGVGRQHADDGCRAANRQALDRLTDEDRVADRLEGVIHPGSASESADRLHGVLLRAVDDVRGADTPGHLELAVEHVEADDLPGATDAGPLDDREPDAAAPEHGDGLARLEPRAPERGADAGEDAAPDERGAVERQVGVDPHHRVLVQQHALGVAADPDELPHGLAFLRESRRAGLRARDDAAGAEVRMPAETLRAASAESRQAGHHVIAGTDRGHVGTHRLDDAGPFVSQHDRPIERPSALTVHDVKVAVADAGRRRANEHLSPPRFVDVDRLDRERLVDLPKDRGLRLHDALLLYERPAR